MTIEKLDSILTYIFKSIFNALKDFHFRKNLYITYPRNGQKIKIPETCRPDNGFLYEVSGHLSRISSNEELWLLTQDPISGKVWPQAFENVIVNKNSGEWTGSVYLYAGSYKLKIVAVLAPPTSQQFFRYYLEVGSQCQWAALKKIPEECSIHTEIIIEIP